jgi:hypothetical protein
MNKVMALVISVLLIAPAVLWGQEGTPPRQAAITQEQRVSKAFVFREITLHLRDGATVGGRLMGVGPEAVRVRQGGVDLDVPFRNVGKAVLTIENNGLASKGVAPGIALGLYIGNGLLSQAFKRPGFYLKGDVAGDLFDGGSLIAGGLAEVLFAATGGALGWLAGSGGLRKPFEFPEDAEAGRASWEEFVRYLSGEPAPSRVHLMVQAGWLLTSVSQRLEDGLAGTGFAPPTYNDPYLSNFSYLRGLQLTYSFRPRFQAGLRLSFPSEPGRWTYGLEYYGLYQEFRATALHGVLSVEPLQRKLPRRLSWSVGLGVGAARIRVRRDLYDSSGWEPADVNLATDKTLPSGVVFTMLEYRLAAMLFVGLAADWTLIPAAEAPSLADYGIPGLKVGLSSASAGLVLGFHF